MEDLATPAMGLGGGATATAGMFLLYKILDRVGLLKNSSSNALTEDKVKLMILETKEEIMEKLESNQKEITTQIAKLKL